MRDKCQILKESKTIAVIGISNKPGRVSGPIAVMLKDKGYQVVGVHPIIKEIDGIKVYKNLKDIELDIDIVNVFRRSSTIPEIIPDLLEIKPKVLWLQLGIKNDEAVKPVKEKGIDVIQDSCIKIDYYNCM